MLFRKVLRDLKENSAQFLAIFVMTMIALIISSGFDAGDKGVLESGSEYLTDVNFKDMDVSGASFCRQGGSGYRASASHKLHRKQ